MNKYAYIFVNCLSNQSCCTIKTFFNFKQSENFCSWREICITTAAKRRKVKMWKDLLFYDLIFRSIKRRPTGVIVHRASFKLAVSGYVVPLTDNLQSHRKILQNMNNNVYSSISKRRVQYAAITVSLFFTFMYQKVLWNLPPDQSAGASWPFFFWVILLNSNRWIGRNEI